MLIGQLEYQLDNSIMTQRTLRLRVGGPDVAQFCDRVAAKLRKQVQVGGFRKGRAPLAVLRRELWPRISGEAFQELKRAALDQVLDKLDAADRPLIPPEAVDADKLKLVYGQELEFAVKYLIDPSGITKNPAQPQFQPGAAMPGVQAQQPLQPPGGGPELPMPPRPTVPGWQGK